MTTEITTIDCVRIAGRKAADLELALNEAWPQLKVSGSLLNQAALDAGFAIDELPARDALSISKSGAPIVPGAFELLIAVVGSQAAARVGRDLWEKVLLPYLRRRWGDQAIERGEHTGEAEKPAPQGKRDRPQR